MPKKLIFGIALPMIFGWVWAQDDVGTIPRAIPPHYALTNATVIVGNGEVLNNATVIVQDGLITAVGAGVEVPATAWNIDAGGMYVYPGLIDALTTNGLKREQTAESDQRRRQRGRGQSGASQRGVSDEGPGLYAHVAAADQLEGDDQKLSSWREAGVLSLHVAPDEGIFEGTTAVVNLNGGHPDEMILHSAAAMKMSYQSLGFRTYPGSLMGVIAHIRQTLDDAKHYQLAWAEYSRDKRGLKRPETDRTLEALGPVVKGEMALLFPAHRAREIRRSLKLAGEAGAGCIIAGGFEADQVADQLRASSTPVLLSLNYPKAPRDPHPETKEDVSDLRYRVNAPAVAGRLQQAGVKFAFYSDGAGARDFVANIRKAVERGLDANAALQAATLSAAQILGVEDQLGSVEKGKVANLMVTDGPLFEEDTQIRHVMVDGIHHEIPEKKKKPEEKKGEGALVEMTGNWDVTVHAPGQSSTMTFELTQDGSTLSGAVVSEMGSAEILESSVTGDSFSFKIEVDMGQGPAEITFSGTVSGDSISGTATVAGLGSAPMDGRRVP